MNRNRLWIASVLILLSAVSAIALWPKQSRKKFILPDKAEFNCPDDSCVYYHVPGPVFAIKQPTKNSCWATALTMLFSWKEKRKLDIQEVVNRFGQPYVDLFKNSEKIGINLKDEFALYKAAGLSVMQQLNPSIRGWEEFLKEYGPLSVTIDARPPYGGMVHAIVVTGIYGRKDASKTRISYIDPLDGKEHLVDFLQFIKNYEAKHSVDWLIQAIHLPGDS